MMQAEVVKLAGTPTEIDTIGFDLNSEGSKVLMVAWQYGDMMKYGNQRVEFTGNKVHAVIADGKNTMN